MTVYPYILLAKSPLHYDWYEVVEDCICEEVIIKAGFTTDFASVPQFLWWLIPPHGTGAIPSIVHDYLYQVPNSHNLTRLEVDRYWRKLLIESGVPTWQTALMYGFVRLLGQSVWEKYRQS